MKAINETSIFFSGHANKFEKDVNPYQVYEENRKKYVQMLIVSNNKNYYVDFDYDNLDVVLYRDKEKKEKASWHLGGTGYALTRLNKNHPLYDGKETSMQNLIFNHKTIGGKGTGSYINSEVLTVDHIDRNDLNNRLSNLELKDHRGQKETQGGSATATSVKNPGLLVVKPTKGEIAPQYIAFKEKRNPSAFYPEHIDQQNIPIFITYHIEYKKGIDKIPNTKCNHPKCINNSRKTMINQCPETIKLRQQKYESLFKENAFHKLHFTLEDHPVQLMKLKKNKIKSNVEVDLNGRTFKQFDDDKLNEILWELWNMNNEYFEYKEKHPEINFEKYEKYENFMKNYSKYQ